MTDTERAGLQSEKTTLARKLALRENESGFQKNVAAIRARLGVIEALLADG